MFSPDAGTEASPLPTREEQSGMGAGMGFGRARLSARPTVPGIGPGRGSFVGA